jgi:hypothetical protein
MKGGRRQASGCARLLEAQRPAARKPSTDTSPLAAHSSSLEATRALMPESPIETSAQTSSRMRHSRAVTSVENMWLIPEVLDSDVL